MRGTFFASGWNRLALALWLGWLPVAYYLVDDSREFVGWADVDLVWLGLAIVVAPIATYLLVRWVARGFRLTT